MKLLSAANIMILNKKTNKAIGILSFFFAACLCFFDTAGYAKKGGASQKKSEVIDSKKEKSSSINALKEDFNSLLTVNSYEALTKWIKENVNISATLARSFGRNKLKLFSKAEKKQLACDWPSFVSVKVFNFLKQLKTGKLEHLKQLPISGKTEKFQGTFHGADSTLKIVIWLSHDKISDIEVEGGSIIQLLQSSVTEIWDTFKVKDEVDKVKFLETIATMSKKGNAPN